MVLFVPNINQVTFYWQNVNFFALLSHNNQFHAQSMHLSLKEDSFMPRSLYETNLIFEFATNLSVASGRILEIAKKCSAHSLNV